MSLVKWVEKNTRLYPAVAYRDEYTPVIPLAALTEVVEGLRRIAEPDQDPLRHSTDDLKALSATLGMLNAGREEAQRLLAQLEAVTK